MPDPLEIYLAGPDATGENQAPSASKRLREVIGDAFTFLRSYEANQAFATVTLEGLITDQIARNGDTARSNAAQYDPYSYNPTVDETASGTPIGRANYLGGSDTKRPTKLDRVLAVMNSIQAVVTEIQTTQPVDVASPEEYSSQIEVSVPTQDG
jgi:hypothetical protein